MSMLASIRRPGRRLAGIALAGILAGGLARLAGADGMAEVLWASTTAVVLAPLLLTVAADLRRGDLGVDLIALLAMAGSLALGQYLAGAVIALMLSGGQALETFAGSSRAEEPWRPWPVRASCCSTRPGTITMGKPALSGIETFGTETTAEVLRLAASLDQVSQHVLAAAVVRAARDRSVPLSLPRNVEEAPGRGIAGEVDGRRVALGKLSWLEPAGALPAGVRRRTALDSSSNVFVAVDGKLAGALILHDPVRPDSPRALRALRRAGSFLHVDRIAGSPTA